MNESKINLGALYLHTSMDADMPGTKQTKANESNYSKHDILVFHLPVKNEYRSGSNENVVQVNVWEWRESYNEKETIGMYMQ